MGKARRREGTQGAQFSRLRYNRAWFSTKNNKYSAKNNTVEEVMSQANVSKVPVNSNLSLMMHMMINKLINLQNVGIKHPFKKNMLVTY